MQIAGVPESRGDLRGGAGFDPQAFQGSALGIVVGLVHRRRHRQDVYKRQLFDLDPRAAITCDKWVLGSKEADRRQILEDPVFEDYHLTMENVYADLPEILSGAKPGRERDDETIVYTHFGMGALDVAVGKLIYDKAVKVNAGQIIRMD